jgi:hypothetical protein
MSILRLGVVALAAAAAILGFKKVKRSREGEVLAPPPDVAQDEPISDSSWPVGARS